MKLVKIQYRERRNGKYERECKKQSIKKTHHSVIQGPEGETRGMRKIKYSDNGCEFSRAQRTPNLQIVPSRMRIWNSHLDTSYPVRVWRNWNAVRRRSEWKGCGYWRKQADSPQKSKCKITMWPSNSTPSVFTLSGIENRYLNKYMCTLFMEALFRKSEDGDNEIAHQWMDE